MWKLGKITAKTHIGDYGQIVDSFVLLLKDTCCEEVKMTNGTDFILEKNYNDLTGKVNAKGVTEISICETEEEMCIRDSSTRWIHLNFSMPEYRLPVAVKKIL